MGNTGLGEFVDGLSNTIQLVENAAATNGARMHQVPSHWIGNTDWTDVEQTFNIVDTAGKSFGRRTEQCKLVLYTPVVLVCLSRMAPLRSSATHIAMIHIYIALLSRKRRQPVPGR